MNTINTGINNTPQFKGIILTQAQRHFRRSETYLISEILAQRTENINSLTRFSSMKKLFFLRNLADRYNQFNYYLPKKQKEDSSCVNRIFKTVKNPKRGHFSLVSRFEGSIQALERIFVQTKSNRTKVDFAKKVNDEIINGDKNANQNLIAELLESENSKEYINNYETYKSYLILNKQDNNAIKNLDEMINQGNYSRKKYDKLLNKHKIVSQFRYIETETFNKQTFYDNYTTRGNALLKTINTNFYIEKDTFAAGTDKDLLEIFKTTTKDNFKIRQLIASRMFNHERPQSENQKNLNIAELNKLYKRIDIDKEAEKFVKQLLKKDLQRFQLNDINKILDNIPAFKLNIFFENAERIIYAMFEEDVVAILKRELENPFFETQEQKMARKRDEKYGYRKEKSVFHKVKQALINQVNIFHYNLVKHKYPETPIQIETSEPTIQPKPLEENITKSVVTNKQTAKIDIKQNIFEIIQSKLGTKTLEKQKDVFNANATKIRLSVLPEIFASITDTRKADRAVGKYRINSSNKDALELFLLTNGNNKKYINYLLKKRNVDNTRMFEVKEIIEMVKKAEAKIAEQKKNNPEYRARDARRYYNHLYEAKIEQYGKVQRQKVNKKA